MHNIEPLYLLYIGLSLTGENIFAQNAMDITKAMFAEVKTIHTLKYLGESNERINGKMKFESAYFKIQEQPFKIYVYQNAPKTGAECLYVTGKLWPTIYEIKLN